MRSRVAWFVFACLLLATVWCYSASAADEPLSTITLMQSKPASVLDVFMLAAIDEMQDTTHLDFAKYLAGEHSLLLAQHSINTVPRIYTAQWESDAWVTFGTFLYKPATNRFVASFQLRAPDSHRVFQRDLTPQSDKSRDLFLQEELAQVARIVDLGLTAAAYRVASLRSDLEVQQRFLTEVRKNTSIVLQWEMFPASHKEYSEDHTLRLLANKGVLTRIYVAHCGLSIDQAAERTIGRIVFRDFKDAEAAQRFYAEQLEGDDRR
jgi:hypothetical protein